MRTFSDEGVLVGIFVAADYPLNPEAITVTEWVKLKNMADHFIIGESEFVQTDSDEINQKRYSDKGKVAIPTSKNATGKAVAYRSRTVLGVEDIDDVLQYFDDRQEFMLIKRKGVPEDTAAAAGQDYEWFKYRADAVKTLNDNDGGFEVVELPFKFNGGCGFGKVVAP